MVTFGHRLELHDSESEGRELPTESGTHGFRHPGWAATHRPFLNPSALVSFHCGVCVLFFRTWWWSPSLMASVPVLFIRNRNKLLSRLVEERTHKLQETMEKLALEERNSAVHEERNRIANEIHDSVQQGLSGLKLILDSLLKFDHVSDEVRSRLKKAKTILAFTHQEVHHAVWDMEANRA